MAKPTKKSTSSTKVTRIKASDDGNKKAKPVKTATKSPPSAKQRADSVTAGKLKKSAHNPSKAQKAEQKALKKQARATSKNPFVMLSRYIAGAWYELRQVRWPDRTETWKMTGALLAFTAFFVLIILLLDMVFKYLFELVIG